MGRARNGFYGTPNFKENRASFKKVERILKFKPLCCCFLQIINTQIQENRYLKRENLVFTAKTKPSQGQRGDNFNQNKKQ